MKTLRIFFFYWLPVLLLMTTIFILSSRERISVADTYIENFTIFKTLHILEYGLLYLLIFRAMFKTFSKKVALQTIFIISIFIAILYGASDEIHQTFVPTRQGSIRDVFIDTIGILIAFSYTKKYLKNFKRFI